MDTAERIARLEKANRSLTAFVALLVAGAVAFAAMGAQRAGQTIGTAQTKLVTAQSFNLVDDQGKTRGMLTMIEGHPVFQLIDDVGNVTLRTTKEEMEISLQRAAEENATIVLNLGGEKSEIAIKDEKHHKAVYMATAPGGFNGVAVLDPEMRAIFGVTKSEKSSIVLYDKKGDQSWGQSSQ